MALLLVKRYPTQIESDLSRYHGIDIADWHRGTLNRRGTLTLSSRKLLVFLERLPDTSQFKTWAERHGDWTDGQKMLQLAANEVSQLRASYHAVARNDPYDPTVWRSPGDLRAAADLAEDNQELQDDLMGHLFGL
jgi:hypothetical protein